MGVVLPDAGLFPQNPGAAAAQRGKTILFRTGTGYSAMINFYRYFFIKKTPASFKNSTTLISDEKQMSEELITA